MVSRPSLFLDSDGTSQREAVRRWHLNTVLPLAKILEHEFTVNLEAEVKLKFDTYALDMVSRAQVVAKLTAAGVSLPVALDAVGLGVRYERTQNLPVRTAYRYRLPRLLCLLHPARGARTPRLRMARSQNSGERIDKAKALEAFTLQVEAGEVEIWLKEICIDAWLRGYYAAKAAALSGLMAPDE